MTGSTPPSVSRPALKCFRRALAFVAGVVALFAVLYAAGYEPYESPQIRSDRKNLSSMKTANVVVFGSSHGFNLLPDDMGFDGVNLSHGGQDAFEMVYMARAVKRSATRLELVIFTLSYFSFAFDNAAYVQGGTQTRIGRRIGMYSAFPSFGFVPGDATSYLKGLLHPIVTQDHWKTVLWPEVSDAPGYTKGSDLPPNPRTDKRVASEATMVTHARRRCNQYKKYMRKMASHHEDLENDVYDYLRDVSRELESDGVRVVFVTPPYFRTYNECFDGKRQALTRRLARRLTRETGAEYIDAGKEPEFSENREFFRNSDHMNGPGKVAFSRWLGRKLGAKPPGNDARPSRRRRH